MATSRIPATIDALVSQISAVVPSDVTVYDGPVITGAVPRRSVHVGYDGDPEGEFDAAAGDQEWRGIGAKARQETFTVTCAVIVIIGGNDGKAARDEAFTVLGEIEDALRVQPSLGLPPMAVADVRNPTFYQEPTRRGWQARLRFDVGMDTRI